MNVVRCHDFLKRGNQKLVVDLFFLSHPISFFISTVERAFIGSLLPSTTCKRKHHYVAFQHFELLFLSFLEQRSQRVELFGEEFHDTLVAFDCIFLLSGASAMCVNMGLSTFRHLSWVMKRNIVILYH